MAKSINFLEHLTHFFIFLLVLALFSIIFIYNYETLNNNTERCKKLGYNGVSMDFSIIPDHDVCWKETNYVKGTANIKVCSMKLNINKTAREWCE